MSKLTIIPICAFENNYIWLLIQDDRAIVIDPGESQAVIAYLEEHKLNLTAILITHHHFDHIDGVAELISYTQRISGSGKKSSVERETTYTGIHNEPKNSAATLPEFKRQSVYAPQCTIYGPEDLPFNHTPVQGGVQFDLAQLGFTDIKCTVLATPGHTLDHLCYWLVHDHHLSILFCGDTLFSCGCGRLFEGSAEQMFDSLNRLAQLPPHTHIYCAHEYTLDNIAFALACEPYNTELQKWQKNAQEKRQKQHATLPTTLMQEKLTNPFLRCTQETIQRSVAQYKAERSPTNTFNTLSPQKTFTWLRLWKDHF